MVQIKLFYELLYWEDHFLGLGRSLYNADRDRAI